MFQINGGIISNLGRRQYLGAMSPEDNGKASEQKGLRQTEHGHEEFAESVVVVGRSVFEVSQVGQKQKEEELRHGDDASHEEADGHAVVELAHNDGATNAEAEQHEGGPYGGEGLGTPSGSNNKERH